MIPDETVEEVRSAADIVEIIGEFVQLRRSGATWRGPCPFHQGKNPNFSVSPSHGSYHCFVCGESGDVFTFVRKRLGLDWPGAVKYVGEKSGIEVVEVQRQPLERDPNAPNHEALAAATEWYQAQLADEAVGAEALAYCEQRGLSVELRTRFGLGFAPRDSEGLRRHLRTLGHDDERLLEAGLLVAREGSAELRSRFRGRVMFPIHDELGRPVAFGGRAIGSEQPKYLNSPESVVFQKRRTLYGLHIAKQAMRRSGRAIVVEGYLDAIRVSASGLAEVVAPLGTALTEEQARLLVRYAREVFLVYDSDEAGLKATFRSGIALLREAAAVRVVTLPEGEDPDSFICKRGGGSEAMEQLLSEAMDLFDRQVQLLERRGWFSDLRKRRRAVDKLLPTIRAAADPLTRDLYLARLADITGLDKDGLRGELAAPAAEDRGRTQAGGARALRVEDPPPRASEASEGTPGYPGSQSGSDDGFADGFGSGAQARPDGGWRKSRFRGRRGRVDEWRATALPPRRLTNEPVELALIRAMLSDSAVVEQVAERHPPESFRDAAYRELFGTLLNAAPNDDLESIAARVSDETASVLRELTESPQLPPDATDVSLNLGKLDARLLEERINAIRVAMQTTSDRDEQDALIREHRELKSELLRLLPIVRTRTKPKR